MSSIGLINNDINMFLSSIGLMSSIVVFLFFIVNYVNKRFVKVDLGLIFLGCIFFMFKIWVSHLCRYCLLWGLIPLTVLFSPKTHSSRGKGLDTLKGGYFL